jgi:hypothetical protein
MQSVFPLTAHSNLPVKDLLSTGRDWLGETLSPVL